MSAFAYPPSDWTDLGRRRSVRSDVFPLLPRAPGKAGKVLPAPIGLDAYARPGFLKWEPLNPFSAPFRPHGLDDLSGKIKKSPGHTRSDLDFSFGGDEGIRTPDPHTASVAPTIFWPGLSSISAGQGASLRTVGDRSEPLAAPSEPHWGQHEVR